MNPSTRASQPKGYLLIIIVAVLSGCAAQQPPSSGSLMPLKPIKSIIAPPYVKADLARRLENRSSSIEIYYSERYCELHHLGDFTENAAKIESGSVTGASKFDFYDVPPSRYIEVTTTDIAVRDDRLQISPILYVGYAELAVPSVSLTHKGTMAQLSLGIVSIKDLSIAEAPKIAHDLSLIQGLHSIRSTHNKQTARQLAAFKVQAAHYRALAVKPAVSERQRKFIVQANFMAQQKDYDDAIRLYQKAIKLNPVSYPAAYFKLAVFSAQVGRYERAISYMKEYLLLVPQGKDARSAKDKIYVWQLMLPKTGSGQ